MTAEALQTHSKQGDAWSGAFGEAYIQRSAATEPEEDYRLPWKRYNASFDNATWWLMEMRT